MTSDQICEEYVDRGVKLTIRMLDEDDRLILIEGKSDALEFLGKYLLAAAKDDGCGSHLGPHTAGNKLFSRKSTKGIYVHRLPCSMSESKGSNRAKRTKARAHTTKVRS